MLDPVTLTTEAGGSKIDSMKVVTPKLKKFKKIPVFIVENHDNVMEFLLKCFATRHLPFENIMMIHFDSHPDMCIPRLMPAKTVYQKSELLESLSIENWIIPTLFAGHLNEVQWVRPPWAKQIPDGQHTFFVGDYNDRIHVSSTLDYFLTDGCYQRQDKLQNKKKVTIHVSEMNEIISNELLDDDENKHWILDIDLDYFSTHNPFLNIYPKAETYEKLRKLYSLEKNYDPTNLDSVDAYVSNRNKQLDFFETLFGHMAQFGNLDNFKCDDKTLEDKYTLATELIDCLCYHYSIYEIDWFIVNDAGCTTDDLEVELPHHESTTEEFTDMIKKFEKFLKSLKKPPTVITIARSSLDDYTPVDQVDIIQNLVLEALRNAFKDKLTDNIALWYKNDLNLDAMELVEPRNRKPTPSTSKSSST
ncbi:unnamed protein product [Diamesa tonsa]